MRREKSPSVVRVPIIKRKPIILRKPVISRTPHTQNTLAESAGRGECKPEHVQLLLDSIEKLIYDRAKGYRYSSMQEIEDLHQQCRLRFIESLPRYRMAKSSLTTWVYYVCQSVLNRDNRESKRMREKIVFAPDIRDTFKERKEKHEDILLQLDIKKLIVSLFERHPSKRHILLAMFGDPSKDSWEIKEFPRSIADVHRETRDFEYNEVAHFFKNCVRPAFEQHFKIATE